MGDVPANISCSRRSAGRWPGQRSQSCRRFAMSRSSLAWTASTRRPASRRIGQHWATTQDWLRKLHRLGRGTSPWLTMFPWGQNAPACVLRSARHGDRRRGGHHTSGFL